MEFIQIQSTEPIIRVFAHRNKWTPEDDLAFYGPPPFEEFRPKNPLTPVHVTAAFTWDRRRARDLAKAWSAYYRNVQVGGPAFYSHAGEFVAGRYLKVGCTITSRGCPKKCGWCNVPTTEGALRELDDFPAGWIVQDNNLLACSRKHADRVFDMLRSQKRNIYFNGGLDKDFFQPWHRELFDSISIGELWFACDRGKDYERLERIRPMLEGIPMRKLRCYTMIGYDEETLTEAEQRIEKVFALGFMPFTQLFQPPDADVPTKIYGPDWKAVMRKWARPAAYMSNFPSNTHKELHK